MLRRHRPPFLKRADIVFADRRMTQCSDRRHHPAPLATATPCIPCRDGGGGGGGGGDGSEPVVAAWCIEKKALEICD
jgi:hypothetical protein